MTTLKIIEKIVRENAFDEKKKRPGLKFNPGLALIGRRSTRPWPIATNRRVPSNDLPETIVGHIRFQFPSCF